ncbi:hypothetical protein [Paraburkholderia franconis]|uniref:hypothetical protein n=1 Tax=Paraburkholderia franconis TaxID=2654983 RepID=UPI00187BB85C|nr:hypothetical protein [Paraburkholderia franconis]
MMWFSGGVGRFFGSKKPVDGCRKVLHNLVSLLLMQQRNEGKAPRAMFFKN